jgi:hypothetical protein
MSFYVHFEDDTKVWVPWSTDISQNVSFEAFCRSTPELFPLIFTVEQAKREIKAIMDRGIEKVRPGDKVYVDLRCYGEAWYEQLQLPDPYTTKYVLLYEYGELLPNGKKIVAHCKLFKERFVVHNYFVFSYGSVKVFDASKMMLIDKAFVQRYSQVLPGK